MTHYYYSNYYVQQHMQVIADDIMSGGITKACAFLARVMDNHFRCRTVNSNYPQHQYNILGLFTDDLVAELHDYDHHKAARALQRIEENKIDELRAEVYSLMNVKLFFVLGDRESSIGSWPINTPHAQIFKDLDAREYDVRALMIDGACILQDDNEGSFKDA